MGFFDKVFNKKEEKITSYEDFWNWFQTRESSFFETVKQHKNIEKNFIDKVSPKLQQINKGFLILTGMLNEHTAELIVTADGQIKTMVFIEELIASAPEIDRWEFTALKPAVQIDDFGIEMNGFKFNCTNLNFTHKDVKEHPDHIDISIYYDDFNEENRDFFTNGIYIFLDNFLGELDFATTIDTIEILGKESINSELIPINKLKDFLIWRQKEFIEKYEAFRYDTVNDNYSSMEATLANGRPLIAIINTTLLEWEDKVSHPWLSCLTITYKGNNNNGLPNKIDYELCQQIEEEIMNELKDADGYLNIGRQTADNEREIYFACKDFRKPSKVLSAIEDNYKSQLPIRFEIYKDKYWLSLSRFNPKTHL